MTRQASKTMVLMLMSGDIKRFHMAFMTAAAAAAVGHKLVLFASKDAVPLLTPTGWQEVGGVDYDTHLTARGIADLPVLAEALRAMGAYFYVCDASLAEHDLGLTDIDPRLGAEVAGLAALLEKGSDANWLTF